MDQHGFRILGLDTSFTKPEDIRAPERAGKPKYNSPQTLKFPTSQSIIEVDLEKKITVRLSDLLPLLIEASQKNRAWIQDFGDDKVTVSQDLYEVALAYRSMKRAA